MVYVCLVQVSLFFSMRRRHTIFALVTVVQTWALPNFADRAARRAAHLLGHHLHGPVPRLDERGIGGAVALARREAPAAGQPDLGVRRVCVVVRQIGRASCRSGGCSYVSLWVSALYIKKQKHICVLRVSNKNTLL